MYSDTNKGSPSNLKIISRNFNLFELFAVIQPLFNKRTIKTFDTDWRKGKLVSDETISLALNFFCLTCRNLLDAMLDLSSAEKTTTLKKNPEPSISTSLSNKNNQSNVPLQITHKQSGNNQLIVDS